MQHWGAVSSSLATGPVKQLPFGLSCCLPRSVNPRLFRCLLVAIFALFTVPSDAQQTDCNIQRDQNIGTFTLTMKGPFADPELSKQIRLADNILQQRQRAQTAETLLNKLLDTASQERNPCAEGFLAFQLGSIALREQISSAEGYFRRAENSFREANSAIGIAVTHYQFAYLAVLRNNNDEAAHLFAADSQELEQANDKVGATLARLEQLTHTHNPADSSFAELLTLAKAQHSVFLEANVLHYWGDRENARADYAHALEHYQQADKLFITCQCRRTDRAYVQTSIGRIMRLQGRPKEALPHYRLAMRLQMEDHDLSFLPQTINAMAVAYDAMGDLNLAIATYKQALAVAHQIKSEPFIHFLEANLGYAYLKAGKPRSAIPLLEKAVARQTAATGHCIRNSQLAEAYMQVERLADAEAQATKAVDACQESQQKDYLVNSYETRARILLKAAKLEDSLRDIQSAQRLTEEIRSRLVPEDAYKQGYMQRTMQMYDTSIEILMRLHRTDDALETAEQARARAFLDLMYSSRQAATEPQIRSKKAALNSRDVDHPSSRSGEEKIVPSLLSDTYVEATPLKDIHPILDRLHSTLIAYWIADGRLYTWIMRPGQPSFGDVQKVSAEEIARLIQQANPFASAVSPGASSNDLTSRRAAWRRLYDLLIWPIEKSLPRESGSLLTIVPSGPLFRLPFAALIDSDGNYLIERFAVHTIPAIGLLRYTEQNDRESSEHTPHYLFVANPSRFPDLPGGRRLPRIPGTDQEVKAIAQQLPAKEVTLLEGDKANTAQLLANLPQATVLHFATHAVVSDTDPFGSFLALNVEPGGGELTIAQVYRLRLHTRMVVLSACRTGLGDISADGVAGLSRAFFYSGAASVIATLWDVADEPTARLLPVFYRKLQSGESRSAALREAQLSLISDLRHKRVSVHSLNGPVPLPENPAFWAAFSLSGEP